MPIVKPIVTLSLLSSPPPPLLLAAPDDDGVVEEVLAVGLCREDAVVGTEVEIEVELEVELAVEPVLELEVELSIVLCGGEDEVATEGVEDEELLIDTG